jgi:hypothetical protein
VSTGSPVSHKAFMRQYKLSRAAGRLFRQLTFALRALPNSLRPYICFQKPSRSILQRMSLVPCCLLACSLRSDQEPGQQAHERQFLCRPALRASARSLPRHEWTAEHLHQSQYKGRSNGQRPHLQAAVHGSSLHTGAQQHLQTQAQHSYQEQYPHPQGRH